MQDILNKIKDGIIDLFPEVGNLTLTAETSLGQIPDFDSMASVNFQTFLEESFPLRIPLDMINEETTLGELAAYINGFLKKKAAA